MRQLVDWSAAGSQGGRPSARVALAARAAYGHRVPPSELAQLLWDSDARGPGGRPAPEGLRRLWFGTDGLGLELVVGPPVEGRRALNGRLVPAAPAALALLRDTGEPLPVAVDDAGRFTVSGVTPGLLRLRSTRPGRRPLFTAWVLLE